MALQEAWQRGLEWDEEFLDDLKLTTHQWAKELPEAPQVKIPRCYRHHEEAMEDVSPHTFVNASVSIPSLELMAAVLEVKLGETVSEKLEIPLSQHTLWTDSVAEIYWIQGDSRWLKPLDSNRITEIQGKLDPAQSQHVPEEQNPAGDATRGLDLKNLSAESRWFQGRLFLDEGETSWPSESRLFFSDCRRETRAG